MPHDAARAQDAATDAQLDAPSGSRVCRVAMSGGLVAGAIVGMGGGSLQTPLACGSTDERIVGIQIEMSDNNANGQQSRSARGIGIGCATLAIDDVGGHLGTVTVRRIEGDGGSGWQPSTWQPYTACPANGVVVAIAAHGGAAGNEANLFTDVSMTCGLLDATGAVGNVAVVSVMGTLAGTGMHPSSSSCPAGHQITTIAPYTGAGLDRIQPSCTSIACE